jgi:hypothetical protein
MSMAPQVFDAAVKCCFFLKVAVAQCGDDEIVIPREREGSLQLLAALKNYRLIVF